MDTCSSLRKELEELRDWAYLQRALEKARQAKEQVQEPALPISYPSIFTCGSIIDRIFPNAAPKPQIVLTNLSIAAPKPQIVSPNLSNVAPLSTAPQSLNQSQEPAQPIYYPTIFICGSEYNISYPPQSITNIPAESTSPSSSQRAAREQSSAQTPRIERVGEYSNENTPSSPPQTENFVKRRLDTKRGRVRFSKTWSRDNCSPDHFISFMNTNLRCAIT